MPAEATLCLRWAVVSISDAAKRLLVGRPVSSEQLSETLLPKRIALPVFASDALSSVAYAPNEIFLMLSLAGVAAYAFSIPVALAVAVLLAVVIASYRQNVHAYPSGGGDYEVATVNLGRTAGLVVASALLVDYVLTVAVSIASAAQYAAGGIDVLRGHEAAAAVVAIALLMTMNLRGVRESGTAFAVPTYFFIITMLALIGTGLFRWADGSLPLAESAQFGIELEGGPTEGSLAQLALAFVVLRAFSSGCAALTGVEAISNGVPAFRPPKSANAAATLAMLGGLAVAMMVSVVFLAGRMHVRYVDEARPWDQLTLNGQLGVPGDGATVVFPDGTEYHQVPLIGQLAHGIFDFAPFMFFLVSAATGLILVLAANTAFNGFPVLASVLAKDGFLPKQLHSRGDRLAFSNGILVLAGLAALLVVAFDAQVTRLIQLYIVGVFISFTLSQAGMIRHWTRALSAAKGRQTRAKMQRSRAINTLGLVFTVLVLAIVLATKFLAGAWIAILAMTLVFGIMKGIKTHYLHVAQELNPENYSGNARTLPSRVHAIVLISSVLAPTLRALAYAKASRPATLEAITVDADPRSTANLMKQWEEMELPVSLKVLESPYREVSRPIITYIRSIRRQSPRELVAVYIPEYVVGRWWEQMLHNQTALRLKSRLHYMTGVVVVSVPWQLSSAEGDADRFDRTGGGANRGLLRYGVDTTAAAKTTTGRGHRPGYEVPGGDS
ncbi:MAG: DNA-binding protein [Micrococcales bacterium]|nr:MAG: DNA-binding protein [Micrococcales bacterium]PIE27914.1 MAG: DNA-binding protein [Micrococcales bacterium]